MNFIDSYSINSVKHTLNPSSHSIYTAQERATTFSVDNNEIDRRYDPCHNRNDTKTWRHATLQQESNSLLEHNLQSCLGALQCEILCLNILFTSHLANGNTNILLHVTAWEKTNRHPCKNKPEMDGSEGGKCSYSESEGRRKWRRRS